MPPLKNRHLWTAVGIHARSDIRAMISTHLFIVACMVIFGVCGSGLLPLERIEELLAVMPGTSSASAAVLPMICAIVLPTMTVYLAYGLASDFFTEHMTGSLFRLRILPFGLDVFIVSRLIAYSVLTTCSTLLTAVVLWLSFLDHSSVGELPLLMTISGCALLAGICSFPVGMMLGSFNREFYIQVIMVFIIFALIAISGTFLPPATLPGPLEWVPTLFPSYWVSQWARLMTGTPLLFEVGGYHPWIGAVVMMVWLVGGVWATRTVLARALRRSSISQVVRSKEKYKSIAGV